MHRLENPVSARETEAASVALGRDVDEEWLDWALGTWGGIVTPQLREELRRREREFERRGGRGVVLADEIDELRAVLAIRGVENPRGAELKVLDWEHPQMFHEFHRISYMDDGALARRMTKITHPQKLFNFWRALRRERRHKLAGLAERQLQMMGYSTAGGGAANPCGCDGWGNPTEDPLAAARLFLGRAPADPAGLAALREEWEGKWYTEVDSYMDDGTLILLLRSTDDPEEGVVHRYFRLGFGPDAEWTVSVDFRGGLGAAVKAYTREVARRRAGERLILENPEGEVGAASSAWVRQQVGPTASIAPMRLAGAARILGMVPISEPDMHGWFPLDPKRPEAGGRPGHKWFDWYIFDVDREREDLWGAVPHIDVGPSYWNLTSADDLGIPREEWE